MTRFNISLAILATLSIAAPSHAFPGAAPPGTALADYNPLTGEIAVSINGVNNWFIESASGSLTGDEPSHSPIIPGSLPSNFDDLIGETALSTATGTNVSLGNVAATGLPLSDLTINWNAGLGSLSYTQPVSLWQELPPGNQAPEATINGPFVVNAMSSDLSISLDASNSLDDGHNNPLTYKWDLDNNGVFEVSTGVDSTLAITDVTSTFGGVGTYPISIEVFDGELSDIASTSLEVISQPTIGGPGPAAPGTASALYDPTTGEIVVSFNDVINWFVESASHSLTGDPANFTRHIPGSTSYHGADEIAEAGAVVGTGTNVSLGYVAETGIGEGDLTITWYAGAGTPSQTLPVVIAVVPEPSGLALVTLGMLGIASCRRRSRIQSYYTTV